MLVIERLERLLGEVAESVELKTDRSVVIQMIENRIGGDGDDGLLNMLSLISDAREEIVACQFRREGRRESFLNDLADIQKGFVRAIGAPSGSTLVRWIYRSTAQLKIICASVTEALDADVYELDRPAFIFHTQELIADVGEWQIDEYAKRNLLLSLQLVSQQAQAEAVATSDAEVRRRIKLIVAAFAVEFAELDKEFETRWEMIKRWARFGYKGAGVPLGLTVDASNVVALLEAPK